MLPTASTTAMVSDLFEQFYTVFTTNWIPLAGALMGIAIVFFAYRKLKGVIGGRRG